MVWILTCLFCVRAFALDKQYTTSADYIMFDIDKKILYCEGQTELTFGMLRVQSENMRVDTKTHILHAEGTVTLSTLLRRTNSSGNSDTQTTSCGSTQVTAPAAVGLDGETMEEEADRKMKEIDACERSGNIQNYEGDVLYFDLDRMAGVLIKTKTEVRKIYLQGEELYEVSEMPRLGEPQYLYEEPDIMANAVTAKRVRIAPDDAYEAWNTVLWFKGNRLTQLPYWTNTSSKLTRGNIRLKRVKYSSNSDWGLGARYRYSETRGRKGFVDVDYYGDGNRTYVANLSQQFRFKENLSGNLGIGSLFGGRRSYSLSLSRHGGGNRNQNMSLNFARKGSQSFRFGSTAKLGTMQIQSYIRASRNKHTSFYSGMGQSNLDAMIRLMGKTRDMFNNDKYKYRVNSSLGWDNRRRADAAGNAFVGISVFRSGIQLSDKMRVSTSFNGGLGAYTEGSASNSFGSSVRLSHKVGKGKTMGFSYKYNQGRSFGSTSTSQSISSTYSFVRGRSFNIRLSSSYDLRRDKIGTLSTAFNYDLNRKTSVTSNLIYDVERSAFSFKTYNLRHDFYGSVISTYWDVETNDLIIDYNSNF